MSQLSLAVQRVKVGLEAVRPSGVTELTCQVLTDQAQDVVQFDLLYINQYLKL